MHMPSELEILIHERIMDGCTHPGFVIEHKKEHGLMYEYVVCSKCGGREPVYRSLSSERELTEDELLGHLKARIPPHCLDNITTRRVLRKLESKGWKWSYDQRDDRLQFTITRGGESFVGKPSATEHIAVANALRELVTARWA